MVLWKSLGSILLVLSLLLVACGDDDDPSPADAQASLCEDLAALESEMTTLTGMSAESSIEDLKEQRDQVDDAFDAVVDSADDVADAETDSLEQAFEELDEAALEHVDRLVELLDRARRLELEREVDPFVFQPRDQRSFRGQQPRIERVS